MTDIVERLRRAKEDYQPHTYHFDLVAEAADEIERLRAKPDPTIWVSTEAMNSERNATIERCALVADGFMDTNDAPLIAAAIRALKDKP